MPRASRYWSTGSKSARACAVGPPCTASSTRLGSPPAHRRQHAAGQVEKTVQRHAVAGREGHRLGQHHRTHVEPGGGGLGGAVEGPRGDVPRPHVSRHLRSGDLDRRHRRAVGPGQAHDAARQRRRHRYRGPGQQVAHVERRPAALVGGPRQEAAVAGEPDPFDVERRRLEPAQLAAPRVVVGEALEVAVLVAGEVEAGRVGGPGEAVVGGGDGGREQRRGVAARQVEQVDVDSVLAARLGEHQGTAVRAPGGDVEAAPAAVGHAILAARHVEDVDVEVGGGAAGGGIGDLRAVRREAAEDAEGVRRREQLALARAVGRHEVEALALVAAAVAAVGDPAAGRRGAEEGGRPAEGELVRPAAGGVDHPHLRLAGDRGAEGEERAVRGQRRPAGAPHVEEAQHVRLAVARQPDVHRLGLRHVLRAGSRRDRPWRCRFRPSGPGRGRRGWA